MTSGRTIIVGDIHGCLDEFDELLRKVGYERGRDRLILAGDLVDRGPDSAGVVRRAMEIGAEAVMGNHDEWHLRYARHEDRTKEDEHYKNPMKLSDNKRAVQESLGNAERAWLEKLPNYLHVDKKWTVVHAGCVAGAPVEKQNKKHLWRLRYVRRSTGKMAPLGEMMTDKTHAFWTELWRGPRSIVYGHHPDKSGCVLTTVAAWEPNEQCAVERMIEGPNGSAGDGYAVTIGIDTGCCYGGRLSAVMLTRWEADTGTRYEIASVPARDKYAKMHDEKEEEDD